MTRRAGVISEFLAFLKENKKWWLVPMLLIIALLSVLVFFSSTPLAPFIYTLF
jgi:competence protein ComGC